MTAPISGNHALTFYFYDHLYPIEQATRSDDDLSRVIAARTSLMALPFLLRLTGR